MKSYNKAEIDKIKEIIKSSNRIVFFGGAGVSTGSGIKDFRGKNGLYNLKSKYSHSYEEMLSHSFFVNNTEEFYFFYKNEMMALDALPNKTHISLADYEKRHPNKLTIVTQNIDSLHQKAGSKNVLELHGSIYDNYCISCHSKYSAEYVKSSNGIPYCNKCGGIIRPGIVLYEEGLGIVLDKALNLARESDVMIVGGTSLSVYPACYLVDEFRGKCLIIINDQPTRYDYLANYCFNDDINEIIPLLLED